MQGLKTPDDEATEYFTAKSFLLQTARLAFRELNDFYIHCIIYRVFFQLTNMDISESVALVTGGARGFGKEIVLHLLKEGAKVYKLKYF